MPEIKGTRGRIAVLTGGGDIPGLNPAIRAITLRAIDEGFDVLGIQRGWKGLIEIVRDPGADNSQWRLPLTAAEVEPIRKAGGTMLFSSRTRPSAVPAKDIPAHLKDKYTAEKNDLTDEVIANLDFLGIDYLIPMGGDDTLSYAVELDRRGAKVVAVPKTMDNDVPGTDYCMGFSTCVTRTISLVDQIKSSAASHERIMVCEVFGRYAGFTALMPTIAGAADRCLIPEVKADIERVAELVVGDRNRNQRNFAAVLVSEGAQLEGEEMVFAGSEKDQYGHAKLGGIGKRVSDAIKQLAPRYNDGQKIDMISMDLGYLVRSGEPDVLDSIIPLVYGNLAIDSILKGEFGRMAALSDGVYTTVPVGEVVATKKVVDVERFYDAEQFRPRFDRFGGSPFFIFSD